MRIVIYPSDHEPPRKVERRRPPQGLQSFVYTRRYKVALVEAEEHVVAPEETADATGGTETIGSSAREAEEGRAVGNYVSADYGGEVEGSETTGVEAGLWGIGGESELLLELSTECDVSLHPRCILHASPPSFSPTSGPICVRE